MISSPLDSITDETGSLWKVLESLTCSAKGEGGNMNRDLFSQSHFP